MTVRPPTLPSLTPRERDVLRLIGDDLSNAEIAERLVVSPQTVKWYVKEIYSKLGVHSRDEALALLDVTAGQAELAPSQQQHHLPAPVTSLVGRSQEITALCALLRDPGVRLVTLLGPPGIGKTRLSIEVARRLIAEFPDGVVFLPLALIADPALVPDAILSALSLEASGSQTIGDRLRLFLRHKQLLLVLDNFEHLLPAAPLVGDLLTAAPGLKVLATSREPLRVYGEREFAVPPLDPVSEGVALFEARAQAVRPDFAVNEHNVTTVTAICQKLDGLPLAIELAAARMKLYTPHALLGRLSSRLNTLTGGARDLPERQQTLRAAIAWSYGLLTPDEQRLFAHFAVFEGGASLDAFAEICGFGLTLDPFDGLESLVSKSLIQQAVGDDGEPRFTMYESLIEFAAEKLAESGNEQAARVAHARFFLTRASDYTGSLPSDHESRAVSAIEADYVNIRAAWLYAAARPDDELIAIAAHNWVGLYIGGGRIKDGAVLYQAALHPRMNAETPTAARLRNGCAWMQYLLGDYEASRRMGQRALAFFEQTSDWRSMELALIGLSHVARRQGEVDEAERLTLRALALAEHSQYELRFEDKLRLDLASVAFDRGHYAEFTAALELQLASVRQRGLRSMEVSICQGLAVGWGALGELDRAQNAALAGLNVARSVPMHGKVADLSAILADIAFVCGRNSQSKAYLQTTIERDLQDGRVVALTENYAMLSAIAACSGDGEAARREWARALDSLSDWRGHEPSMLNLLMPLAFAVSVAAVAGQPERAVELAAMVHVYAAGDAWANAKAGRLITAVRGQLTPEAYAAAWARGEAMTVEGALELARQLASPDPA